MNTERYYLESAMQEAEHAYKAGTYPIGAIIVDPTGEIIGRGHNHVYRQGDFTSHAEMEAIRDAGSCLMKEPNYEHCTLYTTMEPCLMCSGAILLARIARVIWVIDDDLYGALRCLCKNPHFSTVVLQNKEAGFSVSESHFLSGEKGDEAIVNLNPSQRDSVAGSLHAEKIASLPILPDGYAEKIASLSILSARERDLAQLMYDWMDHWNAVKGTALSQWR